MTNRARPWWSQEWLPYLWALVVSTIVTVISLRLWHASLHVPFLYGSDGLGTAGHFSTVVSQGWFEYEPRLGAPAGEFMFDFPQADNFPLILAKFFALFSDQWPVVMNLTYLAAYPLTALAAVWFFRVVGINKWLSVSLAVIYAIAPYHFYRSEAHLYLGEYYAVPLALVILVWIMRGEPLFTRGRAKNPILAVLTGRGAAVVLIGAFLGTASQYYSVFFLLLLAFAGLAALIRHRSWRRFWGAVVAGLVVAATLIINQLPNFIFSLQHGSAIGALSRSNAETEIYSFKFTQLILPSDFVITPFLRAFRGWYGLTYPNLSEMPSLGTTAAVGFIASFVVLGFTLLGGSRIAAHKLAEQRWFRTLTELSFLAFIAFMLGTIGGLSTVISFVTDVIRGWNRISIVLMAITLGITGLLLERLLAWLVRRLAGRARLLTRTIPAIVAVFLVCFGILDQAPYNASASLESNKAQFLADHGYFTKLEQRFPKNATILQLPYIRYPEDASATGVASESELIPFLQTTTLRWTAGGIKGRPIADWTQLIQLYPADQLVALAAASGMDGILIDTQAYKDAAKSLIPELQSTLGEAPFTSDDGRWVTFDLTHVRASVKAAFPSSQLDAVRAAVTNPVMPYLTPDLAENLTNDGSFAGSSAGPAPRFTLDNAKSHARSGTLSMLINDGVQPLSGSSIGANTSAVPDPSTTPTSVTVTTPDGTKKTFPFVDGIATVSMSMTAPPGQSIVQIQTNGETAATTIEVSNILFTESATQRFLDSAVPQTVGTGTQ